MSVTKLVNEGCHDSPNSQITTQKMKFSIKDFFSKWGQINSSLRIWSYLLKKFLMEKFILCAMNITKYKNQL